jgi:hypothetical protein
MRQWLNVSDQAFLQRIKKAHIRDVGKGMCGATHDVRATLFVETGIKIRQPASGVHLVRVELLGQGLGHWQGGEGTADGLAVLYQVPAGKQAARSERGWNCATDYRHDLNLGHKYLHQSMALLYGALRASDNHCSR